MPLIVRNSVLKLCIFSLGAGLASFVLVLLINIVGLWFGFKRDENVPIEAIGYLNVTIFLLSIGLLAVLSYGSVFFFINKLFRFSQE